MKKMLQVFELFRLIILLPFNVTNGRKKRAYQKIKRQLMSVNLL